MNNCFKNINWAELDLNQRSITQRIYNPPPLTTRAPTLSLIIISNNIKENKIKNEINIYSIFNLDGIENVRYK